MASKLPFLLLISSLILLTLGCSGPEVASLKDDERRFLAEIFRKKPKVHKKSQSLGDIPKLVRHSRRAVVQLRSQQKPSFFNYLGGIAGSVIGSFASFPNIWQVVDVPFYVCFGWGLQYFRIGEGTGFIIGARGSKAYLLTNAHVVGDDPWALRTLTFRGKPKPGLDPAPWLFPVSWKTDIIWVDQDLDAALLRVDFGSQRIPQLELGQTRASLLGQMCVALGYPGRGEESSEVPTYCTATLGLVSSYDVHLDTAATRKSSRLTYIQTDAAINPGNSGGPLLTLDSQVVGLNTFGFTGGQNISYAIPIDWVRRKVLDFLDPKPEARE